MPRPTPATEQEKISDELEGWLNSEGDKTLGGLIERAPLPFQTASGTVRGRP